VQCRPLGVQQDCLAPVHSRSYTGADIAPRLEWLDLSAGAVGRWSARTVLDRRHSTATRQCSHHSQTCTDLPKLTVVCKLGSTTRHYLLTRCRTTPDVSPPGCATSRLHPVTSMHDYSHSTLTPSTKCHRNSVVCIKPTKIGCHANW